VGGNAGSIGTPVGAPNGTGTQPGFGSAPTGNPTSPTSPMSPQQ
jgi:hypothetical protein